MASIGDVLRGARRDRGSSIEDAAEHTRVSQRYLEALEANDFEEIPAPVYVRGFLRSYARFLAIDVQPLLDALSDGNYEVVEARGPGLVDGWALEAGDQFDRDAEAYTEEHPGTEWSPEDAAAARSPRVTRVGSPGTEGPRPARFHGMGMDDGVWEEEPREQGWSPWGILPGANRGLTIAIALAVTVVIGFAIFVATTGGGS